MEERKKPHIVLFMFLASLATMSGILYTAALPAITKHFNMTPSFAETTLYLFVFGFAIGSLLFSPIANRFGRKPSLYTGLFICMIGTLFCLASSWFNLVILLEIGRFIQAFGAVGGIVICMTQINDCYTKEEKPKILSIFLLFPFIPNISIILGGYLTEHFGWESCFYFLLFYTIVLIVLSYFFVYESLGEKQFDATKFKKMYKDYAKEFKNPIVVLSGLMIGLVVSSVYIFSGTSPFIGIGMLKIDPEYFAIYFAAPSVFFIVGSLLSALASKSFSKMKIILFGALINLIASIAMLVLFCLGIINLVVLFTCYSFTLIGVVFIASMSASTAFAYSKDSASASAVFNFIALFYATIPVFVLSLVPDDFIHLLPILFTAQAIIVCLLFPVLKRSVAKAEVSE